MTGNPERSPRPSEVGFTIDRRRLIMGGASAVAGAVVLAACGDDDDSSSGDTTADTTAGTDAEASDTGGGDVGSTTLGSNFSDEVPMEALAAAIATTDVDTEVNTVDHNTYQQNFNTYIQQPDDVVSWFAGYRMRAFADKGVVGDLSDVWADSLDPVMSDAFKAASTGNDGKQYFVPLANYAWGVHYRTSLFEENGYEIPATWDDFTALLEQMETDGLIPIAAANDGKWPQMGMFDMINMRVNGYDFHVSLMAGNEDWTDDRVKAVFAVWEEILPYYQPDANGRPWQDAAAVVGDKTAGMMLLGNFIVETFDPDTQQDIIADIDFFPFPEIEPAHAQDAIEAPIDGFMMAASPENEEAAKALLAGLGQKEAGEAYAAVNTGYVAANSEADTSGYTPLQKKAAELIASSTQISQFMDRDTDPDFAANVLGVALADFLTDPSQIDTILGTVQEQAQTYTFE